MKSKLEPHRAFVVAAILEGLPIITVQGVRHETLRNSTYSSRRVLRTTSQRLQVVGGQIA